MASSRVVIPTERIESLILAIRGQRVILDGDLAALYGVTTKPLNQAVKPNKKRFPEVIRQLITPPKHHKGEQAFTLKKTKERS